MSTDDAGGAVAAGAAGGGEQASAASVVTGNEGWSAELFTSTAGVAEGELLDEGEWADLRVGLRATSITKEVVDKKEELRDFIRGHARVANEPPVRKEAVTSPDEWARMSGRTERPRRAAAAGASPADATAAPPEPGRRDGSVGLNPRTFCVRRPSLDRQLAAPPSAHP
eukprot:CAMPEP_0182927036 /NCGR_PEP_ID=MMETSP0105_2-20130417/13004_1 /TAXON_ID=81532 ORGANISM="Acanthoeca-like sp., Strain 10tr" /NCGR_SAMPLE_ID=MMETSP0105_2 /ASSEMBLY_ACC=CAM_ASM_000205 /LENGTH=168 /DNA_ID=CAMNT_0025064963 /DNA_START=206 /DNA_END=712 /DNA_ORIENTATION=-